MTVPITVEYGATIWKVAAGLAALVGLVLVRKVRARRAVAGARADVARRLAGVTAPTLANLEGVAAVTCVLRGGIATTVAIGDRVYHDRAGDLYAEYQGQRIEFAVPLHVRHGTFARASRGLPKATPRAIRGAIARELDAGSRVSRVLVRAAGGRLHRLTQLGDGDAVIVCGAFGKRGGVDRFGVRTWILEAVPGSRAIEIAAASPTASALPLRWYSALALAAVLAGGACAAMYGLGTRALAMADSTSATAHLGALDPLAVAAAMPGTRDDALAEIARRYSE